MRRNPLTIHRDANLVQAVETIFEYKLVGQVSSSNLLWALMEHSRRRLFNMHK